MCYFMDTVSFKEYYYTLEIKFFFFTVMPQKNHFWFTVNSSYNTYFFLV